MRIDIIAVGKLKERFWVEACAEYLKRLTPYARISVTEVADRSLRFCDNDDQIRALEAQDILKSLSPSAFLIVLDSRGEQLDSDELAESIVEMQNRGSSHIAFVIGGSVGVDAHVQAKSKLVISLGKITLPHNLARVVLLEQIYRSFKIISGEPYHK